jgi:hypothetical protein
MKAAKLPKLSEREFQRQVIELATRCGWAVYHTHDSRRSQRGFPDLVLARPRQGDRPGALLFVELKTETGRLSLDQIFWLATLNAAGVTAKVWRPADWDQIERVLAGRAA